MKRGGRLKRYTRIKGAANLSRTTRVRKVSKKGSLRKELDALCRAVVFARDGHRCVKCGDEKRLQWCHVYSRHFVSMRWDPDNSFCGCSGCHLWWHHRPLDASRWFEQLYPERAKRLALISLTKRKPDLAAIKLYLSSTSLPARAASLRSK